MSIKERNQTKIEKPAIFPALKKLNISAANPLVQRKFGTYTANFTD